MAERRTGLRVRVPLATAGLTVELRTPDLTAAAEMRGDLPDSHCHPAMVAHAAGRPLPDSVLLNWTRLAICECSVNPRFYMTPDLARAFGGRCILDLTRDELTLLETKAMDLLHCQLISPQCPLSGGATS